MPGISCAPLAAIATVCGKSIADAAQMDVLFLIAVGFWNFLGAGVFGFLINLPIISYYEVGTISRPTTATPR